MRFLSVFAAVFLCIAAPAAHAIEASRPSSSAMTKYELRAATRAKKANALKKRQSVELPVAAKGGLAFGDPGAATTIVMFTDIECPFCKRFHQDTYPSLKKDYIDTGKVRFVIRHFPLVFHPYADRAARAVVCARAESDEKARSLYELLIAVEKFETGSIKAAAKKAGLDTDDLQTCMESWNSRETVDKDAEIGFAAKVSGTPSFLIIGPTGVTKAVTGAYPFDTFEKALKDVQKK